MVAQLSYTKNVPSKLAGLIYDIGNTNIDSFAAEGVVNHGRFVSRGSDPQGQCLVNGAAGAIGISIRHASENDYKPANAVEAGKYEDEETVAVLREGYIWAEFDAAGGTLDAAVTINASGQVVAAGTGTAVTGLAAYIEKPASDALLEGASPIYVGLIRISAK